MNDGWMDECLYLSLVTSTSEIGLYPAQHIQHIQYDKQGRTTEHFAGQKTAKHEERGGEKKHERGVGGGGYPNSDSLVRDRSQDRSRCNPQARLPETGGTSGEGGGCG